MSNKIDGSIVGELLLGELEEWHVGLCTLSSHENDILVSGPAGTQRVDTQIWKSSMLRDAEVKDLEAIAERVNKAIEEEHAYL